MIKALCALGFVGFLPMPGTLASLITAVAIWMNGGLNVFLSAVLIILCFVLVAVFVRCFPNAKDPSYVVLDEGAGQTVALLFAPCHVVFYILAFVAFRVFDIKKPGYIARCERYPGAWGIMLDDVVAGVMALCLVQIGWMMYGYIR